MSRLALGLDAPNRCDLGSRGRGELGRLVVRWGSHRTVETRDRGSGDFCSRVQVQAAFSAEASAATNIREPPPPTEQALDLPHAADVAHRPSLARHRAPGRPPPSTAELSPEASAVTGTETLSAHVRARRCHRQRRRRRRARLARPDRRACCEAVRHASFCAHAAGCWLPLRTSTAMCPVFGGHLQQRGAQRHPRPSERTTTCYRPHFDAADKKPPADPVHR